jgi:ribose/xylose/arabinose/galactoside ABC-type transport system permease subunit
MTHDRWSWLATVARRQGVLIAFVVLVSAMFATTSTFGTYQNLINVLQQNAIIGIIACGMTFAIILGGFDLSVGSVTALASVVGATLMIDLGTPGIPVGIIGAAAACLFVGATNGWLIAYLGVNPFVATLGTMRVVRGLSENPTPAPANKKIGVSVAYLKVPFYANFKTGLEDGAKQFGFTYDLVDGNSGDVATELANLQMESSPASNRSTTRKCR